MENIQISKKKIFHYVKEDKNEIKTIISNKATT